MQKIKLDGVSEENSKYGNVVTFLSGKNKYRFYATRQDGQPTKAYTQYKKYRFQTGDEVSCEVEEKDESFVNEAGKKINYTKRTIKFFEENDHLPVAEFAPKTKELSLEEKVNVLWAEHEYRTQPSENVPF